MWRSTRFLSTAAVLLLVACGSEREDRTAESKPRDAGQAAAREAAHWFPDLRSDDPDKQSEALGAMAGWYERNVDPLHKAHARNAMQPVVGELAKILVGHANDGARWNACLLLSEMGYRALSATDALVQATKEDDPAFRRLAIEGLARVASPQKGLVDGLKAHIFKALSPEKRSVLMQWRPDDPQEAFGAPYVEARDRALAAVFHVLENDPSTVLMKSAIHHLGSWGPGAVHLAKDVVKYMRHSDADVRQSAVYTIRALKPPANLVIPQYKRFIEREKRHTLRGRVMIGGAILGFSELGRDGTPALEFLRDLARDERLREQAQKAIDEIEAAGK